MTLLGRELNLRGAKMRNRISQRKNIHNGRECILAERLHQGDCLYCPPNHDENRHGHKSKWGRKVAAKQAYKTGKGRKEINWVEHPYWDLWDEHYAQRDKKHDQFLVWECK